MVDPSPLMPHSEGGAARDGDAPVARTSVDAGGRRASVDAYSGSGHFSRSPFPFVVRQRRPKEASPAAVTTVGFEAPEANAAAAGPLAPSPPPVRARQQSPFAGIRAQQPQASYPIADAAASASARPGPRSPPTPGSGARATAPRGGPLNHPADLDDGEGAYLDVEAAQSPGRRGSAAAAADDDDGDAKPADAGAGQAVVYGFINGIVGVPTMVSFAAIVWQHPVYRPFLGQLARLSFLASAIHQAAFTALSSLPFAVGQVQDVGLILLSSIATAVADRGLKGGASARDVVATALVTLALATAAVGASIVAVARLRLAALVQNVPLPVVGGYLGFVGWFCSAAGVSLGTGVDVASPANWPRLLHGAAPAQAAALAATVAALLVTMRHARSAAALPLVLAAVPLVFHAARAALGVSLADAAAAGWVAPAEAGRPFWTVYELFHPAEGAAGLCGRAALSQVPKVVALALVVSFGSCLDVAAIQADTPDDLDFDGELETVGLSNVAAGLLGAGLTGSYIFSQTLFSMRAGLRSRAHGWTITAIEAAAFFAPISILPYLPNFYYGSLLTVFGIDIVRDWLFGARRKVTRGEYALLWATFGLVVGLGLEVGIAAGVLLSAANFAYQYSRVSVRAFGVAPSRAGAARTLAERSALQPFAPRIAAVGLSGYVFFGSSLSISQQVLAVARALAAAPDRAGSVVGTGGTPRAPQAAVDAALAAAPRFLLLDFRAVRGVDATAAQSFASLARRAAREGVDVVVCHLVDRQTVRLLAAHGFAVAPPPPPGAKLPLPGRAGGRGACAAYASMDDATFACEEAFLEVARAAGAAPAVDGLAMTPADAIRQLIAAPGGGAPTLAPPDADAAAAAAARFVTQATLAPRQTLFSTGDPADALYIVLEGSVVLETSFAGGRGGLPPGVPAHLVATAPARRFRFGPGAVVGAADVFTDAPRGGSAAAAAPGSVAVLCRAGLAAMMAAEPAAAAHVLAALLRAEADAAAHALEVLERSAAAAAG